MWWWTRDITCSGVANQNPVRVISVVLFFVKVLLLDFCRIMKIKQRSRWTPERQPMIFAIKITSRFHSAGIGWNCCFDIYSNLFGNILEFVMVLFCLLESELAGDFTPFSGADSADPTRWCDGAAWTARCVGNPESTGTRWRWIQVPAERSEDGCWEKWRFDQDDNGSTYIVI